MLDMGQILSFIIPLLLYQLTPWILDQLSGFGKYTLNHCMDVHNFYCVCSNIHNVKLFKIQNKFCFNRDYFQIQITERVKIIILLFCLRFVSKIIKVYVMSTIFDQIFGVVTIYYRTGTSKYRSIKNWTGQLL